MEHDEVRALEVALLDTWPGLEAHTIGGWRLVAAAGVTGRANSVTVVDPQPQDLDHRIDRVETWYRQRRLRPRVRLTPRSEADLPARLAARGYRDRNGRTDTLVLTSMDGPAGRSADVSITSNVDERWWALTDRPAHQHATLAEMTAPLGDRAGYATLEHESRPIAVGTVILSGTRASIANLHTQRQCRCRGHGRTLLLALHRWARDRGATSAFLHVLHDNAAATHLYRTVGYTFAYSYRYLEAPA